MIVQVLQLKPKQYSMASLNHTKIAPVLPGKAGFVRMTAAEFNAHLLANPESGGRGRHGAAHGGYGAEPAASAQGSVTAKPARARRASPEEDLHRLVFDWVFAMEASHPILRYMMHVPNGGARSKGEAGKLKAMGVRKGVSDVTCPFASGPFKGFACELKAPKGRCTPEQSDFLDKSKADGWLTGVCFSLDEFVAMAQSFLGVAAGSLVPSRSLSVLG